MSRGPGRVQQAILSLFEGRESDEIGYWTIRDTVIGDTPTPAQLAAFSRALWGLHKRRQLAACCTNRGEGPHMWYFALPEKDVIYAAWKAMLTDNGWVDVTFTAEGVLIGASKPA